MKNSIKTALLASTLALAGCISPEVAEKDRIYAEAYEARHQGEPTTDRSNEFFKGFLLGGPLYRGLGNQLASQGKMQAANGAYIISDTQRMQYDRNTAMQAAREGRSQIIINNGQRESAPAYKSGNGLVIGQWVDLNNDKRMEEDEVQVSYSSYFGRNSNIQFALNMGVYGNRSYFIRIQNESGKVIDEKRDTLKLTPLEIEQYKNNQIDFKTAWNLDCSELGVRNSQGQLVQSGKKNLFVTVYLENEQTPRETQRFGINFDKIFAGQ